MDISGVKSYGFRQILYQLIDLPWVDEDFNRGIFRIITLNRILNNFGTEFRYSPGKGLTLIEENQISPISLSSIFDLVHNLLYKFVCFSALVWYFLWSYALFCVVIRFVFSAQFHLLRLRMNVSKDQSWCFQGSVDLADSHGDNRFSLKKCTWAELC